MIYDAEKANRNFRACVHARTRMHTHTHFRVSQMSKMENTFKRSELNFFTLQLGKIKSQRGPGTCPNDTVTGGRAGTITNRKLRIGAVVG